MHIEYNLRTFDDVHAGKYCTFDDAGIIEIGPRTTIGPGVTILTTDCCKDLDRRKGPKGSWMANDAYEYIASEVVMGVPTP
jgi:acetyltransferase-like isoleucine patch superfamily enzyme